MDSEIKSAAESVRERLEFRKRLKANANAEEREKNGSMREHGDEISGDTLFQ